MCALKTALKECKIYGPLGDPEELPPASEVTLVPWEEVKASRVPAQSDIDAIPQVRSPLLPRGSYQFADRNQVMLDHGQDVWGETMELSMTAPKQTARPQEHGNRPTAEAAVAGQGGQHGGQAAPSTSGGGSAVPAAGVVALGNIQ